MSGVQGQINVIGAEDLAIFAEATETLWMAEMTTYTPYAVNTVRIEGQSGSALRSNGSMLYNGHGNGDLVSTVYVETDTPALATNGGTDAHYVPEFGFAHITDYSIQCGTQQCEKKHSRWAQAIIEYLYPEGLRWEECVGKFDKEVQLIQHARSDNKYFTPLFFSQTRYNHCAMPTVSLHHTVVQYKVNHAPIKDCVVNVGNPSAVPYKFGGTTPIQDSDVKVFLWTTNIFLDDCERAMFLVADLKYITTDTQENIKSINSTGSNSIDIPTLVFQHPVKYIMWFLQRQEATDGSTYQIGKIGTKDPFFYGADHGGESVAQANLLMNSQTLWDVNNTPPQWFRVIKPRESFPWSSKQGPKYFWTFGAECQAWNAVKTLNFSRVDQVRFQANNNNTSSAYTSGNLYHYVENLNVFIVYSGTGGYCFGSAS